MTTIEERLRHWQQELLDLSNRNPLLNFRPSSSKPSTIELIVPTPVELYDLLRQGKSLTVLGNDPTDPEPDDQDYEELGEAGQEPVLTLMSTTADALAGSAPPSIRQGAALSRLPSDRTNRVLLRLAARARGSELELGINTLFAVFGLLKWEETSGSGTWHYAPLLMLPVRIEEVTREGRFRIAASGDDPEFNQTLAERIRRDFGLDIGVEVDEETELHAALDKVREAVSRRSGWEVLDQVHVGHFQFYKLRMYADLVEHAAVAAANDIIQALGSDVMTISSLPDGILVEEELDRAVPPEQSFTILDADASQFLAIQIAIRGSHLIIQGPPGTGKSQTIANIIAECIAAGRTVLFVSEKAAAIDVVHRRLHQRGLSEFCLTLHSHKANKREIIQELDRQLGRVSTVPISGEERLALSQLQEHRLDLNRYAEALHLPREPLGESVFWTLGHLARLSDVPLLTVESIPFSSLTHAGLERSSQLLENVSAYADVLDEGATHPWFGVQVRLLSLGDQQRLRDLLNSLPARVSELLEIGNDLAQQLEMSAPRTVAALWDLDAVAAKVSSVQTMRACWFDPRQAEESARLLADSRSRAARLRDVEVRLAANYEPALFEIDPDEAIPSYEQGPLRRFLSSPHRALRARMRAVSLGGRNRSSEEELAALRDCRRRRELLNWFGDHRTPIDAQLGITPEIACRLDDESWNRLASDLAITTELGGQVGSVQMATAFVTLIDDRERLVSLGIVRERLRAALERYATEMSALAQFFDDQAFPTALAGDLFRLLTVLDMRKARFGDLDRWVRARLTLREAEEAGLGSIFRALVDRGIEPGRWADAYRRLALTGWLDKILAVEPILRQFDGGSHDRLVRRFVDLDRRSLTLANQRVRNAWADKRGHISSVYGGEPGIVRYEAQKKKRHMPLRRLFERIPNLLPSLKPCLMMSPLSVAQYLPADRYLFDVVIFDEASQVRPHDAIGAIMRGRQLIVAGDSMQLPPTSFFDRASDDFEDDESLDLRALESILDALRAKEMPSARLLWHYRSKHEDLIAYSNHHFYEGQLITFPSSSAERSATSGVRLEFVPNGRYEDERDRILKTPIRVNRVEARRVAELVMDHARTRSDESLLVVTLGMRQREIVEEEITRARQLQPGLEEFFREDRSEPFYVKALEQVQGDERDVILISVGYGKNASGMLSHNFGPINQMGGERRLNVLVTRARNQVVLVSSIRYTDIDPNRTQNRGPLLLRNYLEFAEVGASALGVAPMSDAGEYESPFEEEVGEALRRAGFVVHRQVGTSRYRIDLAIVDPRDPGRYILGVECDGKTYHQSKTARDRDRLRQELLEELGWRIHRVWSTEWIRNPERELARIVSRVGELLAGTEILGGESVDHVEPLRGGGDEPHRIETNANSQPADHQVGDGGLGSEAGDEPIAIAYQAADFEAPLTPLLETSMTQVVQAVISCVEAEGPIHEELLRRRMTVLWGYQRAGSRIVQQIDKATNLAIQRGCIRRSGAFLWPMQLGKLLPRGIGEGGELRQIAHIPDEEIEAALEMILERAMSLTPEELVVRASRVFGYQRTGGDIRDRIMGVARTMYQKRHLDFQDGRVQLNRS
jgi:very-short-patch-repair endonuclease/DNA polymerase III delta prime subunit